ncbi:hypothetical protein M0638_26135 [Roseomonas sp. NAR14]|uniref:Uncharacterized protein n=1 Tax=Roseomonas acroporae TaxID=2937791 RepID=A0A9X1YFB4_9PROT|nr:hypothetical protein [Roseomonas acroporae]MCK8787838.1 hypothetical protein [Roseomonas acroporae]
MATGEMASGEGPPALTERVRELAALWRAVTSRPLHPVGCTCMGHFLIPALNARDMEADILDYMRGRYAAEGLSAIVGLLDAREAEREATDIPAEPFRAWLQRLPKSGLEAAAIGRFCDDLLTTLRSLDQNNRDAGGSGLVCT